MTKPKDESSYGLDERGRRKYAGHVARRAIDRITELGLVKSEEFRFFPGITLDRALAQDIFHYQDIEDISFPMWLAQHNTTFIPKDHTIGAWADARTQAQVLEWLEAYAKDLASNKLVRKPVLPAVA